MATRWVAGTKGTAWGQGRDQDTGSHLGQAAAHPRGVSKTLGSFCHQHPQTLLLGAEWEGTIPRGTLRTPLGQRGDPTGRNWGPAGQGPVAQAYPGGGAGVKAISTLILSSFLCCPKLLTAPKPSLVVPTVGGRCGTLGTGSPRGPHHP